MYNNFHDSFGYITCMLYITCILRIKLDLRSDGILLGQKVERYVPNCGHPSSRRERKRGANAYR